MVYSGNKGESILAAVCSEITAPIKTDKMKTMGSDFIPILSISLNKRTRKILIFSGLEKMIPNIKKYFPILYRIFIFFAKLIVFYIKMNQKRIFINNFTEKKY
jgi:hypothetical protein